MTEQKTVNVLLSAYNGEAHLQTQIESVLNQSYPNIKLYIRDDGSTDNTRRLLSAYESNERVCVIYGENKGFYQSFMELLRTAQTGDFWCFCDQDDVWLEDKVAEAVSALTSIPSTVPAAYHSAFDLCDAALAHRERAKIPSADFTFTRCFTDNLFSGFALTFNRAMREAMLRFPLQDCFHDWLAAAIAFGFGEVRFGTEPMALHRRLENSQTKETYGRRARLFLSSVFSDSYMKERNIAFSKTYSDAVSEQDKQLVMQRFSSFGLADRFGKAFASVKYRQTFFEELTVRALMLLGKL